MAEVTTSLVAWSPGPSCGWYEDCLERDAAGCRKRDMHTESWDGGGADDPVRWHRVGHLLPLPLLAILGKRRQGHVGGYKRQ